MLMMMMGCFRRHVVRPACFDSGRGGWVQLGLMSGGHVFDSQVSGKEMDETVGFG